jgi:site-specific DNA recombinase
MKKCFGYIRVSTVRQGDGVSLQEQKDAILAFAAQKDIHIAKWFEEKETAAKSGRPVFNGMLKELKHGKADGLIIHKIDRSARNLKDWAIVSELPDQGIEVHVATESLDFNSRGGRLTADMLAVIASDFIRNLREETIKGLRGRLKQGLYPFRAPLGYLDNGKGKPKTPCPVKASLIKEMFELYGSGQHSLRSLQAEIQKCGLTNLGGGQLSLHGVETILNNSFYTGIIEIKRTGETFQGVHEPIIPMSLFSRVQKIKSTRCGPKQTRHNQLFRGLFRCGFCNQMMSPERQKGNVYYRCHQKECVTKTVREDVLEKDIISTLKTHQLTQEMASELLARWELHPPIAPRADAVQELEAQIAKVEQNTNRATDLLIDGTLDESTFRQKKKEANRKLAELRERLQELPDWKEIEENKRKFLELLTGLTVLYKNLKPYEKRVFIENTFSNLTVVGKKPVLEPLSWVLDYENVGGVSFGDPCRHTDRTFELPKQLKRLFKLLFGICRDE